MSVLETDEEVPEIAMWPFTPLVISDFVRPRSVYTSQSTSGKVDNRLIQEVERLGQAGHIDSLDYAVASEADKREVMIIIMSHLPFETRVDGKKLIVTMAYRPVLKFTKQQATDTIPQLIPYLASEGDPTFEIDFGMTMGGKRAYYFSRANLEILLEALRDFVG